MPQALRKAYYSMPRNTKKWNKMLIRPQQLNLKPKKKVKSEWCGSLAYCTLFDNVVNQDEVYYQEDRLEKGEPDFSKSTIQLKKKNLEKDAASTEDNDLEDFYFDVSDEVFKDIIENEKYWSCDEEELEVYSPFENSDDEIDNEDGECMQLTEGETILHKAKNANNVKKFLYLGYDVNARDAYNETPLHSAIRARDLELIKAFISAGANVNALNNGGQTPLIIAISNRSDMEIVRELLNGGSDYTTVINYFKEKVMHCAWTGELVHEFWKRGAKIDLKDKYGYTPLHRACRNNFFKSPVSAARELIRLGADVNCRDDNGKTPLYHAILGHRWDVMVTLITNGADLSQVISDNSFPTKKCTALDKALSQERMMGQLLIKHILFQNWAKELDFTSIKKYFLNPYNTGSVDNFTKMCISELYLMKKYMIGNYSLFDVVKTQIVHKRIKPLYIDYDVNEEIKNLFPTYYDLISTIINKCKSRATFLAKLKQKNVSLCSKDKNIKKSVVLNYDCIFMICEHLSDEDLSVLLSA